MTTPSNYDLAIIIPAYKREFLGAALESIAAQTDRKFSVYVGNDNSPENLEEIVSAFSDRLNIRYHRFAENAGGRSLVEQWNRSIRLSSEPWIWLFSDDDTMDAGCVEAWRRTAANDTHHDLYRFQTRTIDKHGTITRWNPCHPEHESGLSFAYHRLMRTRFSFACEYIFTRAAFEREGGMIPFPLAWCSDDASWIAISSKTGIRTVTGPMVNWRHSGSNLSSAGPATRAAKHAALLEYLAWLCNRMDNVQTTDTEPDARRIKAVMPEWLLHQLLVADCGMDRPTLNRLRSIVGQPETGYVRDTMLIMRHHARLLRHRLRHRA